jgi:hypothetical protein
MKAMEQRDLSNVIFETNSKSTVYAIQTLCGEFSEFSSIINHIKNVLLSNPNFRVKFIIRQTNIIAHMLTRVTIS